MKNNLFKIPFDAELLYNAHMPNYKVKPEWEHESDYTKDKKTYEEAESKVLFKNVIVEYEKCDVCGKETKDLYKEKGWIHLEANTGTINFSVSKGRKKNGNAITKPRR